MPAITHWCTACSDRGTERIFYADPCAHEAEAMASGQTEDALVDAFEAFDFHTLEVLRDTGDRP